MRHLRPWMFGLAAFLLYAWNLGAADLVTDEAKDALNVAYPHPPLVRVFMKLFAELFGHSEFGARLPSALLGAGSVVLVYLLLMRIIKRPLPAALGALAFMLLPPHLTWVRTAYLSPATEFGWLLAFYGMALVHDEPDRPRGHWIVAAGIVFGTWSNVQTVLIYPAYVLWLWAVRHDLLRDRIATKAAAVVGLASLPVLGMYIMAVRSVRADFGRFFDSPPTWTNGLFGWLSATPLGWYALASLAAAAMYAASILAKKAIRHPALDAAALTIPFVFGLCLMSPASYYAPYYAATGGILSTALLARLPGRAASVVLAATLLPLVLILPKTHRQPNHTTFFHEHAAEINIAVMGERAIGVVGPYGYQVDWYLEPIVKRGGGDLHFWFVAQRSSLSAEERSLLSVLHPVLEWGEEGLYLSQNIPSQPR